MPANNGRRESEPTMPRRTAYNVPPTYQDPVPPVPTSWVPPADNSIAPAATPGVGVHDLSAPVPAPAPAATSNITGIPANPPPGAQTWGSFGMPISASSASPSYEDMLSKYLGQVFGEGRSFAPMEQKILGQRDAALQSMAERMASRGMGNSGLVSTGAADIFGQTGRDLASAYQDWRGQGIQEMRGAIAPFLEEAMAEKLAGVSTEQKKELINAQLEATMRQLFGKDYNPMMGTAEWEPIANIISGAEPEDDFAKMIDEMFRTNPAFKKYFPYDPYDRGGYQPF